MDMAANCVAVQKSPYEILVTMSCAVAWSVPAIRTASSAPHRDALRLLSSAWCECGFSAVLRGLLSAQVRGSHASPYQKKRNADKGPRPPIKNNTFSERGVCGGAMAPSKLRSLRRRRDWHQSPQPEQSWLSRCVRCRRSRLASAVRRSFDVPAGRGRGEGRLSREHFSIRILRPPALFCPLHARVFGVSFAENAGDVQHALARLGGSSQKHVTRSDFSKRAPKLESVYHSPCATSQ